MISAAAATAQVEGSWTSFMVRTAMAQMVLPAMHENGAMLSEGTIERPDGRLVAWAELGDPAGKPVLRLHGTPGSRLTRPLGHDLYERLGADVVTVDRPGAPERVRVLSISNPAAPPELIDLDDMDDLRRMTRTLRRARWS
jgi:hypothetical protein